MAEPSFDVVGIGNAIVDVLAHADDGFLARHGLAKGAMTLVDADAAGRLYKKIGPAIECSGGSAANTIAALASLGGRGAYIGKVRDDQLGAVFAHDLRAQSVHFDTPTSRSGPPTASCLILVTPDAQRTMQTFLGACVELGLDDVDEDLIASAQITYLEGYLWDPPEAKRALVKAAKAARKAGRRVALTLSDPFCVDRHRAEFLDLIRRHVDILFANEHEIMSLFRVSSFDGALQAVRGHCRIAALTRSEKGSVIVSGDEVHVVDAEPVTRVVDSTGAGDAYAAGFLHGVASGMDLARAARIGGIAAAEVISHIGARPDRPLKELVRAKLG